MLICLNYEIWMWLGNVIKGVSKGRKLMSKALLGKLSSLGRITLGNFLDNICKGFHLMVSCCTTNCYFDGKQGLKIFVLSNIEDLPVIIAAFPV